jgi:Tfp pilus assembly protein PilF
MEFLMLKADVCFKSDRIFECEEVFLYILNLKPAPAQAYSIYLRLALTYLNRKSWEDARVTFNKAVELKPNSSAGWMGLGIATLELGSLRESEEAFNLSSIYNPLSKEPAQYLNRISAAVDDQHRKDYKYFQSDDN